MIQPFIHPKSGSFDLEDPLHFIRRATSLLSYVENGTDKSLDLIKEGTLKLFSTHENGSLCNHAEVTQIKGAISATLTLSKLEKDPFVEIGVRIDLLDATQEVRIESIELLRITLENTFLTAGDLNRCRFWGDWHDIWHPVGSRPITGDRVPADIEQSTSYHAASVYHVDRRQGITFLYRQPNQWLDGMQQEGEGLAAINRVGVTLQPHEPLYSDRLLVSSGPLFTEALQEMHRVHSPRRRNTESRDHSGWNSWEAYHGHVTEADIVENFDEINKVPWLKKKIHYITIDDGWQLNYGDWTPNISKFPNGMDGLALKIREAGFTPGIWSAPFLVDPKSELFQMHPSWVLQTNEGPFFEPEGKRHLLDPTHPEVHAHIYQLYRQFYSWGYRYYKTDFLRDSMQLCIPDRKEYCPGIKLYDPQLGIARGMRACMEAIRAGVGEDSFWLGCGTDIGSGALLMDASRSGGDIVSYWTRVPHQARSVIHHFHLHGNLFLIDPDFCIVKGSDTFHREYLDVPLVSEKPYIIDGWEGESCFDADDARAWATLVILSGGLVNITDRIKGLNPTGLSILQTAMHYAGGAAAIPIDVENPIPHILLAEREADFLLGVVNWNHEIPISVWIDSKLGIPFPKNGCLKEIWTGREVTFSEGRLSVELQPHKARLYSWSK